MYTPNVPLSKAADDLVAVHARQEPPETQGQVERRFLELLAGEREGQVTYSPHLARHRHHVRYSGALMGELARLRPDGWREAEGGWAFIPAVTLTGISGFSDIHHLHTSDEKTALKACGQLVRDMVAERLTR